MPFHYRDRLGAIHSSSTVFFWEDEPRWFDKLFTCHRHELHLLMIYWVQRAMDIVNRDQRNASAILRPADDAASVQLTAREREVMAWAARGKTVADTAQILGNFPGDGRRLHQAGAAQARCVKQDPWRRQEHRPGDHRPVNNAMQQGRRPANLNSAGSAPATFRRRWRRAASAAGLPGIRQRPGSSWRERQTGAASRFRRLRPAWARSWTCRPAVEDRHGTDHEGPDWARQGTFRLGLEHYSSFGCVTAPSLAAIEARREDMYALL